jgi:gliding motility-associated lipoprotein GldH
MPGLKYALLLLGVAWLMACSDPKTVFKEYADIPDGRWFVKNTPAFSFRIADASVLYNLFYNVRNAKSYPYYNLYLTRFLTDSTGKLLESRLDELILMDEKTGKPLGDGLGDIFDHKVLIRQGYRFPHPGLYKLTVKQYMRQDPLPDVLSLGLTVEKANP